MTDSTGAHGASAAQDARDPQKPHEAPAAVPRDSQDSQDSQDPQDPQDARPHAPRAVVSDRIRQALAPDPALLERVARRERPWAGRIFAVETLEVELADGSRAPREIVRHHGGAGVVAVREGLVCLVRQYRVAQGRVTLEIPAGKLDAGESGRACAARELAEETGLVAQRLEPLVTTLGSPGFTDEHTEVFLATELAQGPSAPDPGELLHVLWLPVDEVVGAIFAGAIQDAKTVAGLLAAKTAGML